MGCDDSWCGAVPECSDGFMHGGDHLFWVDGVRTRMSTLEYRKLSADRLGHPNLRKNRSVSEEVVKDLGKETRLDVIYRSVMSVSQPCESKVLANLIETNLREFDMYHAMQLWQQKL